MCGRRRKACTPRDLLCILGAAICRRRVRQPSPPASIYRRRGLFTVLDGLRGSRRSRIIWQRGEVRNVLLFLCRLPSSSGWLCSWRRTSRWRRGERACGRDILELGSDVADGLSPRVASASILVGRIRDRHVFQLPNNVAHRVIGFRRHIMSIGLDVILGEPPLNRVKERVRII